MYQPESLRVFFEPNGVALVGVSTETGPENYNVLELLRDAGYSGRLYPVNPKGGTLLGEKVYPSVLDIPDPVELAVISTPRAVVLEVVRQCVHKGIKGLVIITQGFADADAWGRQAQEEIRQVCRQAGVRVIGPNTMGVGNNFNSFSTAFIRFQARRAAVGAGAQSGIFLPGSQSLTHGMGLAADLGNACDVSMAELVGYYGGDPQVRVIALHIEDIKDGREFLRVAREVGRRKPIVVLKAGRSPEGARAAASHSGSLAGESQVYTAALRQAGVIQVDDEEELNDLTKILLTYPPLSGNRVGIITVTGGAGIIALDACSRYGLQAAALAPATRETIRSLSPDWLEPANPVDMWPAAMSGSYQRVLETLIPALMDDPGVDAICVFTPALTPAVQAGDDPLSLLPVLRQVAASRPSKPVVLWFYGQYVADYIEAVGEMGLAGYPSIGRALRALGALYRYGRYLLEPPPGTPAPRPVDRSRAAGVLEGEPRLIGSEAFAALEAYGIPVAPYRLAGSLEEIRSVAASIGYPVVLKVLSPDIIHKSDVGGVTTGITSEARLEQAYRDMQEAIGQQAPGASISGYLVQKEVSGGQEVILGLKRDPRFGPVLLFGLGGIFTEIARDVSFRVAPVGPEEARAMLEETRLIGLLQGARGQEPLDLEAVVDCILALSQLALDFPHIAALDINPLRVLPKGAVALDVRVEWQPAP